MKYWYVFIVVCCFSCNTQKRNSKNSIDSNTTSSFHDRKPRNVIFMIGDGMGLSQITAGLYMNKGQLQLERCKHIGLIKIHSADNLNCDSASGASAFSIGKKTKDTYLGVDSNKVTHETILEEAERRNFATGMVVTSTIVHATPAAFVSHRAGRNDYEGIALDFLKVDCDLIIGGGKKYFERRESDSLNLISNLISNGYFVTDYFEQDYQSWVLPDVKKIVYFTADGDPLPKMNGRDYLPKASIDAIKFLDNKKTNGFFLMIEGSQIDWGGHANEGDYIQSEVLDFDAAIKNVLDFAELDKHTLVVITADHEAGGLAINPGSVLGKLKYGFTTKHHTASMVPVFAFGPGAEEFIGIYENTEIHQKMIKLLFQKK
ncbi:MAG: alkaline phosphatase [Bacteroidota bacterium]|nr:alkaline phosphatase [Bacteroidota bacterium]